MALNLEKQLILYGSYHHNPVNIAIHCTFVPILLWTGYLMATTTGPLIPLPKELTIPNLPPNLGTIGALVYCLIYILMEPVAGGMITPLIIAGVAYANYLTGTYGSTAAYYGLGLHVFSWLAQFIGHGAFEGRAPALLDNLVQAVILAPFFVWMEFLFTLGYRPGLKDRMSKGVEIEITKFKKSQANGHNAAANGKAAK